MKENPEIPVYCIASFEDLTEGKRGLPRFDLKLIGDLVKNFEFTNTPHRHDFYDIVIITEGHGKHTIDFVEYDVKPGTVFFVSPGQVHSWKFSKDIKGYSIFFEEVFYEFPGGMRLRDMPFFHVPHTKPLVRLDLQENAWVERIIQEMRWEIEKKRPQRYAIVRALLEILLLRFTRFYEENPQSELQGTFYKNEVVRNFDKLIDENFREVKTVQEYSERLNLTPKNLNKICKEVLGKSASELIHERVLLEAKRLLLYAGCSMQEIVNELHFNDTSYFVKYFKKYTGHTPERFRANYKNGKEL